VFFAKNNYNNQSKDEMGMACSKLSKCVTVQIFGEERNKLKFDSRVIKRRLNSDPEPSVFLSAVAKHKH
jgi:hypothetical protein